MPYATRVVHVAALQPIIIFTLASDILANALGLAKLPTAFLLPDL